MMSTRTAAAQSASVASLFMRQVYLWMAVGLGITAVAAWEVAASETMRSLLFGNIFVLLSIIAAQIGLFIALNFFMQKLSATAATALFAVYTGLTGVTLSSIFTVYDFGSIANAFVVTAGTFLTMSIYGWVTKRDLTAMGSFLMMGFVGIFIAIIVNTFLQSAMLDFVISILGVLVFIGLTAYDTQKIKQFAEDAPLHDSTAVRRGVILGAFTLYLDFLNLFIFILRLTGGSKD